MVFFFRRCYLNKRNSSNKGGISEARRGCCCGVETRTMGNLGSCCDTEQEKKKLALRSEANRILLASPKLDKQAEASRRPGGEGAIESRTASTRAGTQADISVIETRLKAAKEWHRQGLIDHHEYQKTKTDLLSELKRASVESAIPSSDVPGLVNDTRDTPLCSHVMPHCSPLTAVRARRVRVPA